MPTLQRDQNGMIRVTATLTRQQDSERAAQLASLVGTRSKREMAPDEFIAAHRQEAAQARFRKLPDEVRAFLLDIFFGKNSNVPEGTRKIMFRATNDGRWAVLLKNLRGLNGTYPNMGFGEALRAIEEQTTNVLDNH